MADFSLELEVESPASITATLSSCSAAVGGVTGLLGCQYTPVVPDIDEEEVTRAGQSGGEVTDIWFPNVVETCMINVSATTADAMLYVIDQLNYIFHHAHERQRNKRGPKVWLNYTPEGAGHEVRSEILYGRVGMPGQPLSPMLGGQLIESLPVVWKRRYYWEATAEYTATVINTGTGTSGGFSATVVNHSDENPARYENIGYGLGNVGADENWVYLALDRGTLPSPVRLELTNPADAGATRIGKVYVSYNITSAYDTDPLDSLPHMLEAEDAEQGPSATAKTDTSPEPDASGGGAPVVDVEQGTLSFLGASLFQDTGQRFATWETTSGNAQYLIKITKADGDVTWGYMGQAPLTTQIKGYQDWALTTLGFNGDPHNDSTPESYDVISLVNTVDVQQGALLFVSSTEFRDNGQDFGPWETLSGDADYRIIITKDDGDVTWGYMGASDVPTDIDVYKDKDLSTPGFNGDTYSSGTPVRYEVVKMGAWSRFEWAQSTTAEENAIARWILTSDMLDRMDANWFRILAKFWNTPTGGHTYQVRWRVGAGITPYTALYESEWVEVNNNLFLQELGTVRLPPSVIAESYFPLSLTLVVKLDDTTGTKQMDLDFIQLSPLDGWRVIKSTAFNLEAGETLVDDMRTGQIYSVFSSGASQGNFPNFVARGSDITVSPLHNTMLYFLWENDVGGHGINDEMTVAVKYYPRSLYPYILDPADFP